MLMSNETMKKDVERDKVGDKTPEAVVLKCSGINYVEKYRMKVLSMEKISPSMIFTPASQHNSQQSNSQQMQ